MTSGSGFQQSNATASEPERDPVGPEDLATTVYHQIGIVADKELMAPGNRPIENDLARVEVVAAPGLRPGFRMSIRRAAYEAMAQQFDRPA